MDSTLLCGISAGFHARGTTTWDGQSDAFSQMAEPGQVYKGFLHIAAGRLAAVYHRKLAVTNMGLGLSTRTSKT